MTSRHQDEQPEQKINATVEEKEEAWDPDILNNHEKLMNLKWTDKELELANNSNELVEKLDIVRELILQDCRRDKDKKRLKQKPPNSALENIRILDNVLEVINDYETRCLQVITDSKNKPFWVKKMKEDVLSPDNKDKVKQWKETVELFSKTFEKAQTLRMSRKSMIAPAVETDPEAYNLVHQLRDIYNELSGTSKIFDGLNL